MPGETGVTVVTNARVYYTTRAAAGASGARHSLRPLIGGLGNFWQTSGASRREIAKLCLKLPRRHCEERSDEAIQLLSGAAMDCFAERARIRDPLARNDDLNFLAWLFEN
jgi:hypothetical protein